jgi:soluble lytic murein transglycosylase-like protein
MYDFDVFDGDLALFAGLIHTESHWNPHAVRYEPGYYVRYVEPKPGMSATEAHCRAMSWGLCQVMGDTARRLGFTGRYLAELCDPLTNIELAAELLKRNYGQTNSWDAALAMYNGGPVGNREKPYRNQYYVDRVRQHADLYRPDTGVSV